MNDSVHVLTEQCKCREDLGVFSGGLHEISMAGNQLDRTWQKNRDTVKPKNRDSSKPKNRDPTDGIKIGQNM